MKPGEKQKKLRTLLVSMPWHSLDLTPISIGILENILGSIDDVDIQTDVFFGHLDWVEFVSEQNTSSFNFQLRDYYNISESGAFWDQVGDWIFSDALFGQDVSASQQYLDRLKSIGLCADKISDLRRLATIFIDARSRKISEQNYDLIAFSSVFMQNVASLALAKGIKKHNPSAKLIFGGSNCDDVQGQTLHRLFDFVDFVYRGEAESGFREFVQKLSSKESDFSDISGLCWRQNGRQICNQMDHAPINGRNIVQPEYSSYFRALSNSTFSDQLKPKIVLEGSRGCWWGQKHHCTFCGLNGSFMTFREKTTEQVLTEIVDNHSRHRIREFILADNILSTNHMTGLLDDLSREDLDLSIFAEVKSNLTFEQIRKLKQAGFAILQPGIESLSSHVLKLMKKGNSACGNIRALRDCRSNGVQVIWNILYGFPGETEADYQPVLDQLQSIFHLPPPQAVTRIALERFSPHFNDPTLGFEKRSPASGYFEIYPFDKEDIKDLVYLFEAEEFGITEGFASDVRDICDRWRRRHDQSTLCYSDDNPYEILDTRFGDRRKYLLELPQAEALRLLSRPLSEERLIAAMSKKFSEEIARAAVSFIAENRLTFTELNEMVSIVTHRSNK